jgi:WD40 repeat protein
MPMKHRHTVWAAAFSPDGRTVLTGSWDKTARLWSVPTPAQGDVDRLRLEVQVLTGLELDEQGDYRLLDAAAWREHRDRLGQAADGPGR